MKKLFAVASLLILMAWVACERPLQPGVGIEQDASISFSVIAITTDSVSVSVRWSAVTDPSGISHYAHRDTLTSPAGRAWYGTTPALMDTLTVPKPPVGGRHEHEFKVMAVDTKGNLGTYSAPKKWALTRPDVTGPRSPDSVFIDTLVVIPEVALAVGTWPRSLSIPENGRGLLWTAMIISDDRVVCDTIVVTGALSHDTTVEYNMMTHPWKYCTSAWDSAVARARSKINGSAPARITDSWALALVK